MIIDDIHAIKSVLAGNTQAFQPLVERYQRLVFTSVLKIIQDSQAAEDIAQETFLQAYRSLANFRGEAAFSTWIARIAINKSLDYCRRQKPLPQAGEPMDYPAEVSGSNPEAAVLRKEELWQMREQILGLPGIYRKVIYAYYFKQLSYREIAQEEGISVKTVESRLYRAKAILREPRTGGEGEDVSTP